MHSVITWCCYGTKRNFMQKLPDGIFRVLVHCIFVRGGKVVLNVNEPKKQGPAAPVPN